jgi:hypothetical protein
MANIERRPNGGWRARYYDHAGKQHVKHSPGRSMRRHGLTRSPPRSSVRQALWCARQACPAQQSSISTSGGRIACPLPQGVAPTSVGSVTALRCWLLCEQEREADMSSGVFFVAPLGIIVQFPVIHGAVRLALPRHGAGSARG